MGNWYKHAESMDDILCACVQKSVCLAAVLISQTISCPACVYLYAFICMLFSDMYLYVCLSVACIHMYVLQ